MVYFKMSKLYSMVMKIMLFCLVYVFIACSFIRPKDRCIKDNNLKDNSDYCFDGILHSVKDTKAITINDSTIYSTLNLDSLIYSQGDFSRVTSEFKETNNYTESYMLINGNDSILILIGRAIGATAPMWNYECIKLDSSDTLRRYNYVSRCKSVYSVVYASIGLIFIFVDEIDNGITSKNGRRKTPRDLFVSLLRFDKSIFQFKYQCL